MLNKTETTRLTAAWIALHRGSQKVSEKDENFWAWEELDRLVEDSPEQAWLVITSVLSATQDDQALGVLAAGPLEKLLSVHGDKFIERVELMARQEPKFRLILSGVWQNAMSNELWKRVARAANLEKSAK